MNNENYIYTYMFRKINMFINADSFWCINLFPNTYKSPNVSGCCHSQEVFKVIITSLIQPQDDSLSGR